MCAMWRKKIRMTGGRFKTVITFQFCSSSKYQLLWERLKQAGKCEFLTITLFTFVSNVTPVMFNTSD